MKYSKARYIRDTNLGLLGDPTYRCSEIQVFNPQGINIALNGTVNFTCSLFNINEGNYENAERANNGVAETNPAAMCKISTPTLESARKGIILDLGEVYEIDRINIKHSWSNGEMYLRNVVEISTDGLNWIVVQDSSVFGDYEETEDGLDLKIPYGIGSVIGGGDGSGIGPSDLVGMTIITSQNKPAYNNVMWFEITNR